MVLNKNGGNKGKKVARKDNIQKKIRLMTEEGEQYGLVTKMLGNSQCHVFCLDGNTRLCIIRKKFTGKHKSQHFLKPGSWVLVGLRDWETNHKDKMDKCDLLECYSDSDKQIIGQQSNVNVKCLEEKKLDGEEAPHHVEEDTIVFKEEEFILVDDI